MTINHLFFACDWIVEYVIEETIAGFLDAAADLGCLIWHEGQQTDEGYQVARFIIRVSSQEVLQEFIANGGKVLGLVNWFPIQLSPELIARLPDKMARYSDLAGGYRATIMKGFIEAAVYNRKLRSRLENLK